MAYKVPSLLPLHVLLFIVYCTYIAPISKAIIYRAMITIVDLGRVPGLRASLKYLILSKVSMLS